MALSPLRPPQVRDRDDLFQREARTAIKALDAPGVRRSTVVVTLPAGTTVEVAHQVGKIPAAWVVVDKDAQADVWRDATRATTADRIPLRASATVTVTLQFW